MGISNSNSNTIPSSSGPGEQFRVSASQLNRAIEVQNGWPGSSQRPPSLEQETEPMEVDSHSFEADSSEASDEEDFEGYEDMGLPKDELKIIARRAPPGEGLSDAPDFTPVVTPVKRRAGRPDLPHLQDQGQELRTLSRKLITVMSDHL